MNDLTKEALRRERNLWQSIRQRVIRWRMRRMTAQIRRLEADIQSLIDAECSARK